MFCVDAHSMLDRQSYMAHGGEGHRALIPSLCGARLRAAPFFARAVCARANR
jgi:hypothetical protein